MCGILGLVSPGASPDLSHKLSLLAHRGPDDQACFASLDCFLGVRRLSIIDVAGGRQPLSNEAGTVWVAQNGEIYNHLALRAQLESLGHVFRTRSDTEVIVHAYEAWGADCAARLRGIFAFAVWDAARRRLLLARDHFGVKPLYLLHLPGGGLAFASELAPLLDLLPGSPQPSPSALRAVFDLGFIPAPHTAFDGICQLPPAHTLLLEAGCSRQARYWQLPSPPSGDGRRAALDQDMVEGFRSHLMRAVAEQRMSEVPLGALLSGGLDSSAIAGLLQQQSTAPLNTFNIAFEHPAYDEAAHAALAAAHLKTRHHQVAFTEADFDCYPDIMRRLEAPQASATAVPIYRLYQACRQAGLVVILTGEGADELLGGYHWYRGDLRAQRLLGLPAPLRRALARLPGLPMSDAGRRVLAAGERDLAGRYARWQSAGYPADLFGPRLASAPPLLPEWQAAAASAATAHDSPRRMQALEALTRLPDLINFEVDRMSMAHSVEARVPFLDHELWEYVAGLPVGAFLSGREPKALLRRATAGLLPVATLVRPKHGLAAPYSAWLRRPRLPDWAEQALSPGALSAAGYFRPAAVQRMRAAHQAGRASHARALMAVLSTQVWHSLFIA
jgi:asparagine synthase (glutamine-hydrolysing)